MKKIPVFAFFLFILANIQAQTSIFNDLLEKYVDINGNVDYKGFEKSKEKLHLYLSYLEKTNPEKTWSANKEKAFWINAYNAYTIQLILEEYPLKSITKIKEKGKDAWHIPFAKIGGKTYTLDAIEHQILRKKFSDPRIHVGVNCASISCPKLSNSAFTESNIDSELTRLMFLFIQDTSKNKISKNKVQLSKIFEWFKSDFTKKESIIDFLNRYADVKINKKATIHFLEYNWSLNEK